MSKAHNHCCGECGHELPAKYQIKIALDSVDYDWIYSRAKGNLAGAVRELIQQARIREK